VITNYVKGGEFMKQPIVPRRKFLKNSGAVAALCACGISEIGCKTYNKAATPVTAKSLEGGRIDVGPADKLPVGGQLSVTAPELDDKILVARVSTEQLHAVSIRCTHFGSEVNLVASEKRFRCNSHGSQFGYDGSVIEGPAKEPLKTYEVIEQDGRILVIVPAGD
jgi:cytochrome b6-f complex iron-sulfur subunit